MKENTTNRCNEKCLVYARVVGFYSPVQNWNAGKKHEFELRKTFKLPRTENDSENSDLSVFTPDE